MYEDVLTTGEIARICSVSPKTVGKWFDSGSLRGYRIPGSKDRRVLRKDLIGFMKQYGMPFNNLMEGRPRVMIIDHDDDANTVIEQVLEQNARFEVEVCDRMFSAGMAVRAFRPHAILINTDLPNIDARDIVGGLKGDDDLQLTRLIAAVDTFDEAEERILIDAGFDEVLVKPLRVDDIMSAVLNERAEQPWAYS